MNFQQLSEAIQAYTESTEQLFVQNIPNFVQLCEERISNSVAIPAIEHTGHMILKALQLP